MKFVLERSTAPYKLSSEIVLDKVYLYDSNAIKSKMYLIKGDKVSILDKKILLMGRVGSLSTTKERKKEINMWIEADSIDLN
ncbi:hypothetical protein [Aggregatibacter actinomycetemcomitans]|uniref:hypothetical protein n=1 Tax=Aggregatibacter actinomycetemcomitans TaxID=714 RepID=UPI0016521523|nr:hypothetical protein [Aggregatibacter actinomycetemcomitans]